MLPFIIPAKFTWDDKCCEVCTYENGKMDWIKECELASVKVEDYGAEDLGETLVLEYVKSKFLERSITPLSYTPVDYPPVNLGTPIQGGEPFNANLSGCSGTNKVVVHPGDEIMREPGEMHVLTLDGLRDAIEADPGARWDPATRTIKGSAFENIMASPRVRLLAAYDPRRPPSSERGGTLMVHQVLAAFIEAVDSQNKLTLRLIPGVAKSPEITGEDCLLRTAVLLSDSTRS